MRNRKDEPVVRHRTRSPWAIGQRTGLNGVRACALSKMSPAAQLGEDVAHLGVGIFPSRIAIPYAGLPGSRKVIYTHSLPKGH
jgi:hypothetical protein